MINRLLFLFILFLGTAAVCTAQSTETYLLVMPPSAKVAGSGCACDGACTDPDGTWLSAGSYATSDNCNAAIPMAVVTVTDASGATSANDCSHTLSASLARHLGNGGSPSRLTAIVADNVRGLGNPRSRPG